MVYDRMQAEAILARAQQLDRPSSEAVFDAAALHRLADELEVSPEALAQAIEESSSAGTLVVQAGAVIQQPVEQVADSLNTYLRLRGLVSTGWSVWEQATGWWPDVFRYRVHTPVAVSVTPTGEATRVRLTARLDRVVRAHVLLALLAPAWLLLVGLGGGTGSDVVSWVVPAIAWVAAAVIGFFHRREAIRRRLESALAEIDRPAYQRVPW